MTDVMRRWVFCWAVAYCGFGVICVLTGTPLFAMGPNQGVVALNWFVVAVALTALVAAITRARALFLVAGALSVVPAFGLLMDLVTLIINQRFDNPVVAVNHIFGMFGVVLLVASLRRPSAEPRHAHVAAYVGTVAFLPYMGMKMTWVLGGTFGGMTGAEMREIYRRNGSSELWVALESWGLDATVLFAVLGVILLFGLTRPWGQAFPRWLLLTPALIGAVTLIPYGVIGVGYALLGSVGAVTIPRGDFPTSADALLVGWVGLGSFAVYGVALLVAARSYWFRTSAAGVRLQSATRT